MGGWVWFEGPFAISPPVTQNNNWLVAEGNMEKKIKRSTKSIVLLQNYKMKLKRMIVVLKYKKKFFLKKIDKNIQFISLFLGIRETFISVRVRKVAFLFENWKKLFIWSRVLVTF